MLHGVKSHWIVKGEKHPGPVLLKAVEERNGKRRRDTDSQCIFKKNSWTCRSVVCLRHIFMLKLVIDGSKFIGRISSRLRTYSFGWRQVFDFCRRNVLEYLDQLAARIQSTAAAVRKTLSRYVWNEEPCGERNVTGAVGGAVTLSVGQTELKVITWSYGEEGAIAITISVDSPIIVNGRYEGRLISTSIESLTITELRQEDQGTYLTQIGTQRCRFHLTVFSNLTAEDISIKSNVMDNNTCEISFTCSVNGSNVSITWRSLNHLDIVPTRDVVFVPPSHINFTYICTARNPVSTASKLVHPWEYCKRENTSKLDYTIGNLVRLVISGCVLMISCCILIHHMKTEVFTQRPGSGGI
ncbi:SLAM family member 9-like [Mantella aurantiaca]